VTAGSSLKLKTDENLPESAAEYLRVLGFDALSSRQQMMKGASDEVLSDVCLRERRVLVTLDLDFSDVREAIDRHSPGIIVLRLRRQSTSQVQRALERLVPYLTSVPLTGSVWVMSETTLRIRGG
jgi:predicted nuclease of predicted toxin-antitoxin system